MELHKEKHPVIPQIKSAFSSSASITQFQPLSQQINQLL